MNIFVIGLVAVVGVTTAQIYTQKYDNIDIDQILKSERLLKNYANCLLDKGKCTPDGQELKRSLPDALHSGCQKCSEKQKNGARKILHFLIDNKPQIWAELEKKYDSQGEFRRKYKEVAEKEGIKLRT